ncbi:response regulator [Aquabacterium sp. OR-4]|uniref:response regulator n=1 Tax=Aquabacterium sp. OR-4 TaxID=2978127 RepID=UPI0028C9C490|nr:response regulator [Aquabacterium sp. OR-4]MDT7836243.1 response regulator [Aquabacterium sp. OR-4]
MPTPPAQRCSVLVLADTNHDARGAVDPLRIDRIDTRVCADAESFVAASQTVAADVLVLALRSLNRCRETLDLVYAGERAERRGRQRVLLMVDKDQVREAFELCRAGLADDYVQHWPIALDGYRLRMSVHAWLRSMRRPAGTDAAAAAIEANANASATAATTNNADANPSTTATSGAAAAAEPPALPVDTPPPAAGPAPAAGSASQAHPATQAAAVAEPSAAGPAAAPPSTASAPATAHTRTPQVLLVDDDPFQFKLTRMMLADAGVRLVWRGDARSALHQLGDDPPELVLMDIDMPQLDGIEAVRQLRRLPGMGQVPVIMLTSHSDRARVVQSLQAGASGFVVKPFSKKVLHEVLAKHLRPPGATAAAQATGAAVPAPQPS